MYIIIGNNDGQTAFAKKEAKLNKELVKNFELNCFKDCTDKRITFRAHGRGGNFAENNRGGFGDYTPDSFVQALKEYSLPKSVKEIDLIGCNIGLRVDPKTKSFVEEVADLLAHKSNPNFEHYKDIQIRAFCEENLDNIYSVLLVHRPPDKSYQYAKVYTKNEYKEYKKFISLIKDNKNKDMQLDKNIQQLKLHIRKLEEKIGNSKDNEKTSIEEKN